MAFPTSVNNQITDAVTQNDVAVLGGGPAVAANSTYQSMAHAMGLVFQNSVAAQQQQNTLSMAAANMGILQIYSLDTVASAASSEKMSTIGTAEQLAAMLANFRGRTDEELF